MIRWCLRGDRVYWKDYPTVGILPSGFGSMYTDGGRCCNVVYTLDMDRRCMTFVALRDIEEGEELLIDYQAMILRADFHFNIDRHKRTS
eukprot:COSAG02_NODE_34981_length_475_cov_1.329787_1_plen_88_part_01